MDRKGILIVVSGFSGAGKGTVVKELISRYGQYALSISATTRMPRPGEEEGKAYFFKSTEEFQKMIAEGALIEYARYVDNYYGTPRAYVEAQLARGKDVILEIELQGARKVREQFPEAVFLFVTTKDAKTLKGRLLKRGTETMEVIGERMKRAVQESEGIEEYDYLVVNDELELCVAQIHSIVESEHVRTVRQKETAGRIREDLKCYLKGE